MQEQEIGIEFLKALNRYFTPVAVGTMLCALIVNPALPHLVFVGAVALIIFALTFNVVTAVFVVEHPQSWRTVGYLRVTVNTVINAAAYLLLYPYWPAVWILFALGPVAMAFYGDVGETFAVIGVSGAVMAGAHLVKGSTDPRAWGAVAVQIAFILLLSLFLIRVAALIQREHAPERKT